MRLAIVGAGWAGLAAAVGAREAGVDVLLYEMAARPGGRARSLQIGGDRFDNGQHILIGAYRRCLGLMRKVGVDTDAALLRLPLALAFPDGSGLRLPAGPPLPALLLGIATARGWSWRDRLALLRRAAGWRLAGFRCAETLTVDDLCAGLPQTVRERLIDPLCVAALNTRPGEASAAVFLRVLHDALLGPRGSADLLLPRRPLSALLPDPALDWLQAHGATLHLGQRVSSIERDGSGWRVDGERVDAVLLACSAGEAARLAEPHAPTWAALARGVSHDAIVTVTLHGDAQARLPAPMVALAEGPQSPAQFVFDHGALGLQPGTLIAVASGASRWLDALPLEAIGERTREQLLQAFAGRLGGGLHVVKTLAEKRATFACTPGLQRPPGSLGDRLFAAGDYIAGPYPATLEGALLSAEVALSLCKAAFRNAESAP